MSSVFSDIPEEEWIDSNDHAFAVYDKHPVTDGHILIISKREFPSWFVAEPEEEQAIFHLLDKMEAYVKEKYDPDGFNIGINVGKAAGQTVDHFHVHLIPRYEGDIDDPRGGVRNVLPERGNYLESDVENWQETAPSGKATAAVDKV
ncbi:MAG: HIT family protein [bacterium]